MPTTIPYDPALALGNIVDMDRLKILEKIGIEQGPIDAAQDKLNSLITAKRSLDMTMQELINMKVEEKQLKPLETQLKSIGDELGKAGAEYGAAKLKGETAILKIRDEARKSKINDSIESPIDYNRTSVKRMPLSSDSLQLDAQYFSFDQNSQSAEDHASTIKAYVAGSTSFLGNERSAQMSTSAQRQTASQLEKHNISGTLVISASCTHQNAAILAPFYLDVDKAIRVWNFSQKDKIKMDDPASLAKIAREEGTNKEDALKIISGATYGSSFVGMVHVLNQSSSKSDQQMQAAAMKLQAQMKTGSWFAHASGGFGVDATFANSVKSLLSQQSITSHISLITMGIIPTIEANEVKLAVKQFSNFSPDQTMGELATLNNATASSMDSMDSAAESARTGGKMGALKTNTIKSVMSAVGDLDDGANKMLDINSMMTAFTNYVEKIGDPGTSADKIVGVPLNYYLKPITKAELAQMWVAKYFPGYLAISGDDGDTKSQSNGQAKKSEPVEEAA